MRVTSTRLAQAILISALAAAALAQVATVAVPAVTRLTVEQAAAKIESAGLTVAGVEEDPRYLLCSVRVVGTTPSWGTVLEVGSPVVIRIGTLYAGCQ